MKDNLPEINVKGSREKRGGFLGWLRGLGSGSNGAIGAAASSAAPAGLGAFLAANLGTISTVAVVGFLAAGYMSGKAPRTAPSTGALQSSKVQKSEYVPAILRSQAANQGSSLAMFTDTNKGSGLSLGDGGAKAKKTAAGAKNAPEAAGAAPAVPADPGAADGMEAALAGAAGAGGSSLTSSLGGGSGKFAGMGKAGQGAMQKISMSNNVGTGFQAMPKFNERKGTLLAMKGGARPVFTSGKGGKPSKFSGQGKTMNQLGAMRNVQKTYTASDGMDAARYTMDKAWEGTTADGETPPVLDDGFSDNAIVDTGISQSGSGSSGGGINTDYQYEEPCASKCAADDMDCVNACFLDESPWQPSVDKCKKWINTSLWLTGIGAALIVSAAAGLLVLGMGAAAMVAKGEFLCGLGAAAAVWAMKIAVWDIGIKHEQGWMAAIYGLGAAAAGTAAALGCWGNIMAAAMAPASAFFAAGFLLKLIASALGDKIAV
ncbi:MAG: hypothetical protein A2234_02100 [Elusimicrobia bacterium RIFOXYA2_FULL_58_8]|nr:MAG: hypothetical protein A2234_02100 [Elusimicrobia bacterium RIFOXYA2_FULL_58_8]